MATKLKPTTTKRIQTRTSPQEEIKFSDTPKVTNATVSTDSQPFNKKLLLWPLAFLLVLGLAGYAARNQFIVAMVNGQPVYRHTIISQLEKQNGQQVLDQIITEKLVQAEAVKQGKTVTEEQVDQEIDSIDQQFTSQGQDLNALLAQQGMTQADLRHQIRIKKLMDQLIPTGTPPSEEEIVAQLKAQEAFFPKEMTEADRRSAITNQLAQQQQSQSLDTWLESLKTGANIQYLRSY